MNDVRQLRAGPLSLGYRDDELRDIRIDGEVVLDRLYFALRDTDWLTLPLELATPVVETGADSFAVTVAGSSDTPGAEFDFTLEIRGSVSSLVVGVHYRARAAAEINRIGFCLLHPMEFAGTPLVVVSASGTIEAEFPVGIAPHSPFTDFAGLRMPVGAVDARIDFEGDTFDLEDQRNWIDASYKTFAPPLAHPLPRRLAAGTGGHQSITLSWMPGSARATTPWPRQQRANPVARVGLGASREQSAATPREVELLRALQPAWLAVTLLLEEEWEPRWIRAVAEAEAIGIGVDVSLVTANPSSVAAWGTGIPMPSAGLVRLQAYEIATHVTSRPFALALHELRERGGDFADIPIAGGARSNFTELSRARAELPLDLLDEVVFAANPQVHAFDDESILLTPRALAVAVHDAIDIAAGRPLLVGPLTFKRTFNAVAADPRVQPELPPDTRQHAPIAAEWIAAALDACAGAAGVTTYETRGAWGVLDTGGRATPAYAAIAAAIRTGLPSSA